MVRTFALAAVAVLVAGCADGSATPPHVATLSRGVSGSQFDLPRSSGLAAAHRQKQCPAWPSGSGLLRDGDFSRAPDPGSSWITYYKGTEFAPHWKVTKQSIDFEGGYFATPDAICSIDMDGDLGTGEISHTPFATTSGASYTVTFLFSGNGYTGLGYKGPIKTLRVSSADQSAKFTWNVSSGYDAQDGDFETESWTFVASRRTSKLTFKSLDPRGSCCGPVVAAISVTRD
jgi:hypothetical protein